MTELLSSVVGAAMSYFVSTPSSEPPLPSSQAHHNLRRYAKAAVLPEMFLGRSAPPLAPDSTKSVKNPVVERHERYRRLEIINSLKNLKALAHDCERPTSIFPIKYSPDLNQMPKQIFLRRPLVFPTRMLSVTLASLFLLKDITYRSSRLAWSPPSQSVYKLSDIV